MNTFNIEKLLYVGNKKVKQIRDNRKELIEYIFENGEKPSFIELPIMSCEYFDVDVELEKLFHDFDCEIDCSDFIAECIIEDEELADDEHHTAYDTGRDIESELNDILDSWKSELHKLLESMKEQMNSFYELKSQIVQEHYKVIGVHSFSDDDYVLFQGEQFSFHIPSDEYKGDYFDLENLGELEVISSDINIDCEYNDMTLEQIVNELKKYRGDDE